MIKTLMTIPPAAAMVVAAMTSSAQAQSFTVLHQFDGAVVGGKADGKNPRAALVRDAAGNLFGSTFAGGAAQGVAFKLDNRNRETILFSFHHFVSGSSPASPMVQDQAGNLYGIADGGPGGAGIVFKLSQAGEQTLLFQFQGGAGSQPKVPSGGILRDISGNIFGTTLSGGLGNCGIRGGCGTVYQLDPSGKLGVLHQFTGGSDGGEPFGPLVQDAARNLYGVTQFGGDLKCQAFPDRESVDPGCGVVFKLARNGVFTVLHTFTGGKDGSTPQAGLLLDAAGNLFGTTGTGGIDDNGAVFKITNTGEYDILHQFRGEDGSVPNGGLVSDSAGNLYGTTQAGGGDELGTVFKLSPARELTVLHGFTGDLDGATPLAGVILDAAGNIYGTAFKNFLLQPVQGGNVFKITP